MIRLSFQWSCCHFHLVSCTQQEVKGHFGLASYVKCFGFFWWEWYWIAVNRNMFFVQKYWTKFVWIYSIGLFFPQVVIKYANMPIFNYSSSLKKKNLVNRFFGIVRLKFKIKWIWLTPVTGIWYADLLQRHSTR